MNSKTRIDLLREELEAAEAAVLVPARELRAAARALNDLLVCARVRARRYSPEMAVRRVGGRRFRYEKSRRR